MGESAVNAGAIASAGGKDKNVAAVSAASVVAVSKEQDGATDMAVEPSIPPVVEVADAPGEGEVDASAAELATTVAVADSEGGELSADDTVRAFLVAADWQQRAKFVHGGEAMAERMRVFYERVGDGSFEFISFEQTTQGKVSSGEQSTFFYLVRTAEAPDGFIVSVEKGEGGYRVDWPAFAQFGFGLLEKFVDDPDAEGGMFFVAAKRSHYFGGEVEDSESMICLRVISPIDSNREIYAFAKGGSLVADEVKEQLRWGLTFQPLLSLEWAGPVGRRYITVKKIERMTWRAVD